MLCIVLIVYKEYTFCFICSDNYFKDYWGGDSLAIVDTNNLRSIVLTVDETLINNDSEKTKLGVTSKTLYGDSDSDFKIETKVFHDFKAAYICINAEQSMDFDIEKTSRFLCSDCMKNFYDSSIYDEYRDIAIINFSERILTPFKKSQENFMCGDYEVKCISNYDVDSFEKDRQENPHKIKYNVFFK